MELLADAQLEARGKAGGWGQDLGDRISWGGTNISGETGAQQGSTELQESDSSVKEGREYGVQIPGQQGSVTVGGVQPPPNLSIFLPNP